MKIVNVYEAKAHLSKLVEEVLAGEEVVISKNNKPLVDLKPHKALRQVHLGVWAGRIKLPDNLDKPDPDIVKMFEDSTNRDFPGSKQSGG